MFERILYITAVVFLIVSYVKDKGKTRTALKKSWKAFANIFPAMAGVLALMGLVLTVLSPEIISRLMGNKTGFVGMVITSVVGAITLIPGFIAFPLASSLLERGAGITQIAVFISTLMMVGVVTAPLETKYFGRRETVLRNAFCYVFSFIAALIIGMVTA